MAAVSTDLSPGGSPASARPPLVPPRSRRRQVGEVAAALVMAGVVLQALIQTRIRPEELVTGAKGMWNFIHHAVPPDAGVVPGALSASLQTFDIAVLGTAAAFILSIPVAVCAAENLTPARPLYLASRGLIAVCRAVPDLIWALIFVAAVGLGPFPGVLALSVHSVGMMGRLFAEKFEETDMGPVHALTTMGATRPQIFSHAVVPGTLPGIVGIGLYRFDENIRSSLVLGFVGAGGIGFQIYTAMELFQFRRATMYILMTLVMVWIVERGSAAVRRRIQ